MPEFRLYFLDQRDRIIEAQDMECEDDAAAIRAVEALREPRAMELWRRTRRIRTFPVSEHQG
jgi:hypothetical protein